MKNLSYLAVLHKPICSDKSSLEENKRSSTFTRTVLGYKKCESGRHEFYEI
jgi:hypothetical protein